MGRVRGILIHVDGTNTNTNQRETPMADKQLTKELEDILQIGNGHSYNVVVNVDFNEDFDEWILQGVDIVQYNYYDEVGELLEQFTPTEMCATSLVQKQQIDDAVDEWLENEWDNLCDEMEKKQVAAEFAAEEEAADHRMRSERENRETD